MARFYVSLEDDVMRRFGGDRIKGIMEWAGLGEDVPIENRLISKSIEASQTKVESFHFEIRKHQTILIEVFFIGVNAYKMYACVFGG